LHDRAAAWAVHAVSKEPCKKDKQKD